MYLRRRDVTLFTNHLQYLCIALPPFHESSTVPFAFLRLLFFCDSFHCFVLQCCAQPAVAYSEGRRKRRQDRCMLVQPTYASHAETRMRVGNCSVRYELTVTVDSLWLRVVLLRTERRNELWPPVYVRHYTLYNIQLTQKLPIRMDEIKSSNFNNFPQPFCLGNMMQ